MSKNSIKKLIDSHLKKEKQKRFLKQYSGDILSSSKRAIFALHRNDVKRAEKELDDAKKSFKEGYAVCKKNFDLTREGVWRAGLEEYCEALFFYQYMTKGEISLKSLPTKDSEIIIGGLSDFTGELARQAVLKATEKDIEAVQKMYKTVSDVIEALLKADLTGSLRTKFDQSKQNLRKLEQLLYELSRSV